MRHTFNIFKTKIKDMNNEEKKELLKDLQADLMYSYTRRYHEENTSKCKNLRKQIAILKTSMNMKGFHYNPRS